MAYLYDRLGRRRTESPVPTQEEIPTVDDYNELLQAYRHLHNRYEQLSAELKTRSSELAIREEALQRQSADQKQLQAELVFVKAALQRAEIKEQAEPKEQAQAKEKADAKEEAGWQQRFETLQAEVEIMRKRWEQRYAAEIGEIRNRILLDMLPFADNLDLAIQHMRSLESGQAAAFVGSIETLQRAFIETLRRYGLERQEPLGKPFDPHLHEAVGRMASETVPVDHIAQVIQAGYVHQERVVRPAQVIVSSGK